MTFLKFLSKLKIDQTWSLKPIKISHYVNIQKGKPESLKDIQGDFGTFWLHQDRKV